MYFPNVSCKNNRSSYRNQVNSTWYSQELNDTRMDQLKLIPVHSGDTECSTFDDNPFVRKHHSIGKDLISADGLKQLYLHQELISLKEYNYANVEMIPSQDMFHVMRAFQYFEIDRKSCPMAVRIPLGWVSRGHCLRLQDYFLHTSELLHR